MDAGSLMDGFTVCPSCRALLLPEDEPEHRRWHEQMSFGARALAPPPSHAPREYTD